MAAILIDEGFADSSYCNTTPHEWVYVEDTGDCGLFFSAGAAGSVAFESRTDHELSAVQNWVKILLTGQASKATIEMKHRPWRPFIAISSIPESDSNANLVYQPNQRTPTQASLDSSSPRGAL